MSWISTNNLRRFADKLFHGNLSFGGGVTHNGATTFNGGVKVNTTKAEFAAPVSFTGTTTYKGNEIATKADISGGTGGITVDNALSDTSTNPVQNKVVKGELDKKLSASSPCGTSTITWEVDGSPEDYVESLFIRSESTGGFVELGPGFISTGSTDPVSTGSEDGDPSFSEYGSDAAKRTITFGQKLQYSYDGNYQNIATEDYVESAIAAIASYDDTAF